MPARHVLLALGIVLVWGLNFVVIHWGLEDFPPLLFAALRFTFVALPAVFLLRRPPIAVRWIVLVGLFMSAIQFGLLFVGMDAGLPAGLASLIVQLQVFFTMGLGVGLLGERPGARRWLGAAIAFGGIGVIAAGRAEDVPLLGVALAVGSAASWGAGNICTRLAQAPDAVALVVWSSLVAPLPLLGLSLWVDGPDQVIAALTRMDGGTLAAVAYLAYPTTIFAFGIWAYLLSRHPAATVTPFALFVPVAGILGSTLILGEAMHPIEAVGGAIIVLGLAFNVLGPRLLRRRVV